MICNALCQSPYDSHWFDSAYGRNTLTTVPLCDATITRLEKFVCTNNNYTIMSLCQELYDWCFPDTHDLFDFYYPNHYSRGMARYSGEHISFGEIFILLMDSLCYLRMSRQIETSIFPKWFAKILYARDTREGIANKFKFGSVCLMPDIKDISLSKDEIKFILETAIRKHKIRKEMYNQAEKLVEDNPNANTFRKVARLADKNIPDSMIVKCYNGYGNPCLQYLDAFLFGDKDKIIQADSEMDNCFTDKEKYIMNIWRYQKYLNKEEYDMFDWDMNTWQKSYIWYDLLNNGDNDISLLETLKYISWLIIAYVALQSLFK